MKKLYYVRHGESTYNAQNRYAGSLDCELSAKGKEQAEIVGEKLVDEDIDIIVASPQTRAQQTAAIINQYLKLKIETEEDLREIHVGLYEGLTREEAAAKYPDRWKQGINRSFTFSPHEGETALDVQNRVYAAMDRILARHGDKNVLIVAHGFVGKAVNRYFNRELSDEEFFNYNVENCTVIEFVR